MKMMDVDKVICKFLSKLVLMFVTSIDLCLLTGVIE